MLVELTMRRKPPKPPYESPLDGIRILALLPSHWRKNLRQISGDVVITVEAGGGTTSAEIRAEVAAALADPAVHQWELVACDPLVPGHHVLKDKDQ